jgi:hypothetical protein
MKTEIIDGNKLIAEFMGMKCTNNNHCKTFRYELNDGKEPIKGVFTYLGEEVTDKSYEYLKYHSSWGWLMPVIKKLKGDYKHTSVLWDNIIKVLSEVNILKTWEAVVAYIKWFHLVK